MIRARGLTKLFQVPNKSSGLGATLRHFFKREYREVRAVDGLDLSIDAGEVVGFLGPNGAGKTTALKMLTGLIHPSGGELSVAGYTPFERAHPFLKAITLVMGQKQQLIWDLPTLDSLRINAAVYEVPEAESRRRIDELAGMLELTDKLRQPVRKLSLGERMKAELLAALLHEPSVCFLDEPTLGLDVNAQIAVRRFLKDYNRRTGATVLLTSHYMADITALCDRVIIIDKGKGIHDGPLDELRERVAPFREVKLELAAPAERAELEAFGEVEDLDGARARLWVRRDGLTAAIAAVLDRYEVLDLTITDPAIEEVIGRVFQRGAAGDAP